MLRFERTRTGLGAAALLVALAAGAAGCTGAADAPPAPPEPSPYKQCGTEVVRLGQGFDWAARECIFQAYLKREPAELTTTLHTIEGDPIKHNIKITPHGVEVVTDSKDRFGQQGVFHHLCRNFEQIRQKENKDRFGFALSGCSGAGMERFAIP